MPPLASLAGIVLCGGRSTRMGQDKALLPYAGETLLAHVTRRVAAIASPVIVVEGFSAEPDTWTYSLPPDLAVLRTRDAAPDRGPLEGLAAGLRLAQQHASQAFVTTCDAPELQAGFVTKLQELLGEHDAAAPWIDGRWHPLSAIYRCQVLEQVARHLQADRLRMIDLVEAIDTRRVTADELYDADPGLLSLHNLNRPAEYQAALREAEARRQTR